ncbi:inner membrane protein YiaA [Thalassotalea marina]|uniref:Membrane protein n=1 Tax=Thalassotalea marina TaxID=1673741 RepID=A0A919EMQ3_9GAMM|nr:inner membrane protein YiaA [Thalassotalea marina]GHF96159.1 membrane protein [Thalassotalea marina]
MIINQPTRAFVLTSIAVLVTGVVSYLVGLLNAQMALNEKGYYFAVLLFGLFSFVSLQKTVRDKIESLPTSKPYTLMCWVSSLVAIMLLVIGLYNADLTLSEKGFYGMAFVLSGFAAITVQKNVRDNLVTKKLQPSTDDISDDL